MHTVISFNVCGIDLQDLQLLVDHSNAVSDWDFIAIQELDKAIIDDAVRGRAVSFIGGPEPAGGTRAGNDGSVCTLKDQHRLFTGKQHGQRRRPAIILNKRFNTFSRPYATSFSVGCFTDTAIFMSVHLPHSGATLLELQAAVDEVIESAEFMEAASRRRGTLPLFVGIDANIEPGAALDPYVPFAMGGASCSGRRDILIDLLGRLNVGIVAKTPCCPTRIGFKDGLGCEARIYDYVLATVPHRAMLNQCLEGAYGVTSTDHLPVIATVDVGPRSCSAAGERTLHCTGPIPRVAGAPARLPKGATLKATPTGEGGKLLPADTDRARHNFCRDLDDGGGVSLRNRVCNLETVTEHLVTATNASNLFSGHGNVVRRNRLVPMNGTKCG